MYAVIKTGGKQYQVSAGNVLRIEKLDVATGAEIEFDEVLMVADGEDIKVGTPFLEGSKVTAQVRSQGRHRKVRIIKMKRRKHHMKQMGHRQSFTEVEITGIQA